MEHDEEEPCGTRDKVSKVVFVVCFVAVLSFIIGLIVFISKLPSDGIFERYLKMLRPVPPEIELASMDFTVLNITQTRLSAMWNFSIRIPYYLPDSYICRQGDLQVSLLYKNVTIVNSSPQKYNNLHYGSPQLLKVSAVVSEEDIGSLIRKDIIEDIKERKEVHFGSRIFLTDCRKNMLEVMGFSCAEATLRFEPGYEMKATAFGNHPTCINF